MIALVGAGVVVLIAAVVFGFLRTSAARLVRARRPKLLTVEWGDGVVCLPRNEETVATGSYGIWIGASNDAGHLRVGDVVRKADSTEGVSRELLVATGLAESGATAGRFTGQLFAGPSDVTPGRWSEESIAGTAGVNPAWLIRPDRADSNVWAVHVHGLGTTRHTALRTVPVAQRLGMSSLVPAFRGDGEGPPMPGRSSTLGATEWADIDAAVGFAVSRGAAEVVLFAWSMGAATALMAATHGESHAHIGGVVAIAPVTDWKLVTRTGAVRAHLPATVGSLAAWAVQQRLIQRSLGIHHPIDLEELRAAADSAAEHLPMLVIHSEQDPVVPFSGSRRFAAAHPATVQLESFRTVGHAWEYNAEPTRFSDTIVRWLLANRLAS